MSRPVVASVVAPAGVRDVEVPSTDPVARAATAAFGGPLGRYARVGRALPWQPAAAVLSFVAAVTLALGVFQKGYCLANGWAVPEVFWRGCYSDLPYLFSATPLDTGGYPYPANGNGLTQPPLTGALMWLLSAIVPGGSALDRQRFYLLAWAVVLVVILALLVRVTARSCRRDPWRAAHVAASPLLVTAALVSPDLFGVLLASYGLFLWSRRRPELAGVLFGLAIAARTYPVLLVLVIGLLAARVGRWRDWAALAGSAMLTYVAALALIYLAGLLSGGAHGLGDVTGLFAPYRQWAAGGPDYGSVWYLLHALDVTISPGVAVSLAVAGWVLAVCLGAAVALSAPRRPTIAEVSLIVVGIVLLTGRSLPVQASLWLVPLVALAGLRWRDHLIWASGEVLYFVAIWLYLGGLSDANRALPLPWLLFFSVLRLCGIGWLVVAAWRRAVRRVPGRASQGSHPTYAEPAAAVAVSRGGGTTAASATEVLPTPAESVGRAGWVGRRPRVAPAPPPVSASISGTASTEAAAFAQADEGVWGAAALGVRDELDDPVAPGGPHELDELGDLALDPGAEPDELAGPMAGREDHLTIALR